MISAIRFASLLAVTAGLSLACTGPSGNEVFFPSFPPPPVVGPDAGTQGNAATTNFRAVGDVLIAHCGTMDCHGTSVRNFRVYGTSALRLPPSVPGQSSTTPEEYLKTYESLVMVQPEELSRIYHDGGARPERWIVITKGRGAEHHKGGSRMHAGDDADRCITSWVANQTDLAACGNATEVVPPSMAMPPPAAGGAGGMGP